MNFFGSFPTGRNAVDRSEADRVADRVSERVDRQKAARRSEAAKKGVETKRAKRAKQEAESVSSTASSVQTISLEDLLAMERSIKAPKDFDPSAYDREFARKLMTLAFNLAESNK